jgi:hypothetical protein
MVIIMNILGVQIISSLFAIFMIYVAMLHWKRKEISNFEILFWIILWSGFIFITLFPNLLSGITQLLFFARVLDLLMVLAFMILAFIGYQNYISNKKLEKKLEDLIRKEALKNVKPKK